MSIELNIQESIANADAQAAMQNAIADVVLTGIPCSYCKTMIVGEEYAELVQAMEGKPLVAGSADAMCEACASADPATAATLNAQFAATAATPNADDLAKLKANYEATLAKLAAIEAKEKAEADAKESAKIAAEYAKLLKLNAKLKGEASVTAATATAATATATAATAATAAKKIPQTMGPQDIALGCIDPQYHTKRDKALLALLTRLRTKPEQMKKKDRIPGTYAVKVFSTLKEAKYSQEWVKTMITDALNRNVISRMWIPNSKTGKDMVLYFDARWRANIATDFDRMDDAEIAAIREGFGE